MLSAPERHQLGAVAARVDGDVDEGRALVREGCAERRLERVAGADVPGLAAEAARGGGEIDRRRAAHPGAAVVQAQSLGSQAVETHRLQEGQGRRGKEAGASGGLRGPTGATVHPQPPSHVARWKRLHLVNQGRGGLEETTSQNSAKADAMSLSGRRRRRDRSRLCEASNEASAIHTLIRQRPPTPSCRGPSPYCGENSEPGRRIKGELDIQPPS